MTFGLSSENWGLFFKIVVQPLINNGASVWIFGSRARGDHKKFSDIDVLYSGLRGDYLAIVGAIRENAENSNLPIKIDLVNETELASSYRQNVLRDRVPLGAITPQTE